MFTGRCAHWRRRLLPALVLGGLLSVGASGPAHATGHRVSVADVAGFTKVALSPSYVIVVNVLPPERMFTVAEGDRFHPTEGEVVIQGHPGPIRRNSRHVEAHLYSRATGEVVTDVRPVLELTDRTRGRTVSIDATLMQDAIIGARDQHFGTNAVVAPRHRFTLRISIGSEEVTIDGRLP